MYGSSNHVCTQVMKAGKYTGFFNCQVCAFGGTLQEAIAHTHKNQFVIDARIKHDIYNAAKAQNNPSSLER